MRFFFDTEFFEDGWTIDLISIGIVAEDGREYYAENTEFVRVKASAWVEENVFPHLKCFQGDFSFHKNRATIAKEILGFVGREKPEFWAYYSAYDWVALCQLYGQMIDLPKGWPMWCRDIKQLCMSVGNPKLEKVAGEHNALVDARWNMAMWEKLNNLPFQRFE
jgi:hypothetical protein